MVTKPARIIYAVELMRLMAGGMVLSLMAIEKAFLDLMFALMASEELLFSDS